MTTDSRNLEAIIRRIVADVFAGAVMPTQNDPNRLCLADRRVITLADLDNKLDGKQQIATSPRAVITPAAKDLLRQRSIAIVPVDPTSEISKPTTANTTTLIADADCSDRAAAFAKQIGLRTRTKVQPVAIQQATIVLADLPQRIVCDLCLGGRQAVQIGSLAEARAVAAAMQPAVWVLDMNRLNLIAAVNVAASIHF